MTTDTQNEYKTRLERLKAIKDADINPYPSGSQKDHTVIMIRDSKDGKRLATAGRLMTMRDMGKLAFGHIEDQSGRCQIALKKDVLGDEKYKFFIKKFDMGDFVSVEGDVFTTHKGEKTLLVKSYELLSKSLLPMPEKFHGLKDEEERLRKRYLDMISNPEVREMFIKKSIFWNSTREFLTDKGFVEVETPVLEITAGGADANPFITHHNALDMDLYLRISMGELWQKKLMVAGFEKTFEIGRQFRNEGMDAEHLQDYTQMEYYWGYADWNDGMKLTEELIKYVAEKTFGTLKFKIKEHDIDLGKKWERYDYRKEVLKQTKVDIENTSVDEIKKKLQELKVEYEDFNDLGRGIDQLWKYCRKNISGPGYLVYPPKEVSPLAKESESKPGYVERYQLILAGSELCNGYSELNDPIDQEERFKVQQELRDKGDEEAQMHDTDFVEALKHGMPPTTGLGYSERLFSFLMNKSIRECQIFPLMKPKK
jgi:lysyl-tRNA synthetase, class II